MRRVGARGFAPVEGEAGKGAAFGAVPVHDIGFRRGHTTHHMRQRQDVFGAGLAAHGDAAQAQRQ